MVLIMLVFMGHLSGDAYSLQNLPSYCISELPVLNELKCMEQGSSGLLIYILCAGNNSPMQRDFFKKRVADLLPALRFLGKLYNFLQIFNNIFFNLSHNDM